MKKSQVLCIMISACSLAVSAPGSAQTLEEALALAYQKNPSLLAARAQLRATDEGVPIALSGWRPSVSISGDLSRRRNETEIFGSQGSGAQFSGGTTLRTSQQTTLQAQQPLFRGFRTLANTEQAKANVAAQRARLTSTEQNVMLDAASAYFDVLRDQAVVDLNEQNVRVLNRQLEATLDRFRVGEITRTDVAQAEARLSGAVAARIRAEGNFQRSVAAYVNTIGQMPQALTQPNPPQMLPGSLENAISLAITENPNFIAANFTAEAAQQTVRAVRGELLPTVDLQGSYSRAWDTVADQSIVRGASARAVVTVPLYQKGAVYARLRQAKHTAGQRQLEAEQARLDARESVTSAWENYQAATASIESIAAQINASEIALEGVQREAEVGSRTVLDVLDAEQELLDARVDLVTSQREQLVAAYQLLSSMGKLTAVELGLNVNTYDPTAHYRNVEGQFFGSTKAAEDDVDWR